MCIGVVRVTVWQLFAFEGVGVVGGPARELRAAGAVSVSAGGGEPARARGPVGALPDR